MPNPVLRCDETDPVDVAKECHRVANLDPRNYAPVAYVQKLLHVASLHLEKRRPGRQPKIEL